MIVDAQPVLLSHRIDDLQFFIPWKSHSAVLILQKQSDTVYAFLHIKYPHMITVFFVAVQIVFVFIDRDLIFHTVNREFPSADPVRTGSNGCPQKARVLIIWHQIIMSEYHIRQFSIPVRHP